MEDFLKEKILSAENKFDSEMEKMEEDVSKNDRGEFDFNVWTSVDESLNDVTDDISDDTADGIKPDTAVDEQEKPSDERKYDRSEDKQVKPSDDETRGDDKDVKSTDEGVVESVHENSEVKDVDGMNILPEGDFDKEISSSSLSSAWLPKSSPGSSSSAWNSSCEREKASTANGCQIVKSRSDTAIVHEREKEIKAERSRLLDSFVGSPRCPQCGVVDINARGRKTSPSDLIPLEFNGDADTAEEEPRKQKRAKKFKALRRFMKCLSCGSKVNKFENEMENMEEDIVKNDSDEFDLNVGTSVDEGTDEGSDDTSDDKPSKERKDDKSGDKKVNSSVGRKHESSVGKELTSSDEREDHTSDNKKVNSLDERRSDDKGVKSTDEETDETLSDDFVVQSVDENSEVEGINTLREGDFDNENSSSSLSSAWEHNLSPGSAWFNDSSSESEIASTDENGCQIVKSRSDTAIVHKREKKIKAERSRLLDSFVGSPRCPQCGVVDRNARGKKMCNGTGDADIEEEEPKKKNTGRRFKALRRLMNFLSCASKSKN